jgi:hypothetical protein
MRREIKLCGLTFSVVLARDGIGYCFTVRPKTDTPLIIARGWSAGTQQDALAEAQHGIARYLAN